MSQGAATDCSRAFPGVSLQGRTSVPGDKSISHRALILGAMAEGVTRIRGLLESEDVLRTVIAIRALGATAAKEADNVWAVTGAEWRTPDAPVDCGNSGTLARLLMGAVAGYPIEVPFTGDASLQRRPMLRVVDPLRAMGAAVSGHGTLPILIHGGCLMGLSYRSPHPSAQVKSAILLAGLKSHGLVEVIEPQPSRDHTEQLLRAFGCDVTIENQAGGRAVRLGAQRALRACDLHIPGDPSSAAFPIVAATIVPGSRIEISGLLDNPLRSGLIATLLEMGARIRLADRRTEAGIGIMDVVVEAAPLRGVTVPAARAPAMIDEYPALAVAAAFAAGTTRLEGLAELRVKESDRFAAILAGLTACGVMVDAQGDDLIIHGTGGPPQGKARIAAMGDHRIAMAFLTLGLGAREPVEVDSAAMIATSFPEFEGVMGRLGARIAPC